MEAYLNSPCLNSPHQDFCSKVECSYLVKQNPTTGRWFITIGHAGFNSRANNFDGYSSYTSAKAAVKKLLKSN